MKLNSNVIQAVVMVPLALASGSAVIGIAFAVPLTDVTLPAFPSTAESALLPNIVPEERLASVNALIAFADGPMTAMLAPFVAKSLGEMERFGLLLACRGSSGA